MSINTEGGFFQGCAKKGGFNPGGFFSWGRSFRLPVLKHIFVGSFILFNVLWTCMDY